MRTTRSIFLVVMANLLTCSAALAQVTQYVRYSQNGGEISWGILEGSDIHQLSGAPFLDGMRTGRTVARADVKLEPPADPRHVFGTAFNFRSHLGNREPSEYPQIFLVPGNTLVGPEDDIKRHPETRALAYEAELVVVIGKRAANITPEEAPDYIFGVTIGNDVTDRAWQAADLDWLRAKGARGFNSIGPVLVTGLDYNDLMITGRLNGEQVQQEGTADLLFNMDELVSWISQYFTLEPGDLVWSGTMGATRSGGPGDVYEVEIENVGILRNTVVQGD